MEAIGYNRESIIQKAAPVEIYQVKAENYTCQRSNVQNELNLSWPNISSTPAPVSISNPLTQSMATIPSQIGRLQPSETKLTTSIRAIQNLGRVATAAEPSINLTVSFFKSLGAADTSIYPNGPIDATKLYRAIPLKMHNMPIQTINQQIQTTPINMKTSAPSVIQKVSSVQIKKEPQIQQVQLAPFKKEIPSDPSVSSQQVLSVPIKMEVPTPSSIQYIPSAPINLKMPAAPIKGEIPTAPIKQEKSIQSTQKKPNVSKVSKKTSTVPKKKKKKPRATSKSSSLKVNHDAIVGEPMYVNTRYYELETAERAYLAKFIEIHLKQFPLQRTCNPQKARSVCRTIDITSMNDAENAAEMLRKAEFRRQNNLNSQRSRYKQRVARVSDALTHIYLQDRIALYKRRIQKLIDTVLNQNDKK